MRIPPADFSGREDELNALKKWHEENSKSPIVVSGMGGIGKTSLAAKFAESLPANIPVEWVSAYESPGIATKDFVEKIRRGSKSLIIFDGLDELSTKDATQIIRELSSGFSSNAGSCNESSCPRESSC